MNVRCGAVALLLFGVVNGMELASEGELSDEYYSDQSEEGEERATDSDDSGGWLIAPHSIVERELTENSPVHQTLEELAAAQRDTAAQLTKNNELLSDLLTLTTVKTLVKLGSLDSAMQCVSPEEPSSRGRVSSMLSHEPIHAALQFLSNKHLAPQARESDKRLGQGRKYASF